LKLTFADDDVTLEVDPVALREPEHRVETRVRRSRVPVIPAVTLPVIVTFIYTTVSVVKSSCYYFSFPITVDILEVPKFEIFDLLDYCGFLYNKASLGRRLWDCNNKFFSFGSCFEMS
jgi:hypothetical protein